MSDAETKRRGGALGVLALIAPGILVAATGVGAGDLATAAFTGNKLGLAVLWAVVLGAFLKFVLNEGLARYQLASKRTILEGALIEGGRVVQLIFLAYLLMWSWFVGTALMSACGVAMHAVVPLYDAPTDKLIYGAAHSLVGLALVRLGGFQLFEKVMGACIAVMFSVVLYTAIAIGPDAAEVLRGLTVPTIPEWTASSSAGLEWTVALMGGVGGTLTVLCYGYWIREVGRETPESLGACRLDLAVGYAMTAIFGVAMVIIGAAIPAQGKGAGLVIDLADQLGARLGPAGRWAFLVGAWGAVFSSLLGVWQAVPYVFADFVGIVRTPEGEEPPRVDEKSRAYQWYLWALALVPMIGLQFPFKAMQKVYAVFGAAFMPMLALTLLLMNRRLHVGVHRNRWYTTAILGATLLLLGLASYFIIRKKLGI